MLNKAFYKAFKFYVLNYYLLKYFILNLFNLILKNNFHKLHLNKIIILLLKFHIEFIYKNLNY